MARSSQDAAHIVTASDDNTAKIWPTCTGENLETLRVIWVAAFSPTSPTFVMGSEDGQLLLNWTSGERDPLPLIGHSDNIRSAEFSADSRYILTSSWDRTVRLWATDTGAALAIIPNEDIILDAAFDPSGDRIAYAIRNVVRLRPIYADADDLIKMAKAMKPRDLSPDERRLYLLDE